MKLVFYDDNYQMVDEIPYLENPRIFGRGEVIWDSGGASGINQNYVIIEDNQNFYDLSREEILAQFKRQMQFEVAIEFDRNRIDYLVDETIDEEEEFVKQTISEIKTKATKEEVIDLVDERKRMAQERRNNQLVNEPQVSPDEPQIEQEPVQIVFVDE